MSWNYRAVEHGTTTGLALGVFEVHYREREGKDRTPRACTVRPVFRETVPLAEGTGGLASLVRRVAAAAAAIAVIEEPDLPALPPDYAIVAFDHPAGRFYGLYARPAAGGTLTPDDTLLSGWYDEEEGPGTILSVLEMMAAGVERQSPLRYEDF